MASWFYGLCLRWCDLWFIFNCFIYALFDFIVVFFAFCFGLVLGVLIVLLICVCVVCLWCFLVLLVCSLSFWFINVRCCFGCLIHYC